ncbi:hypothetical protein H4582DRAFT_2056939 [Lactarius indigo]|nr:hypothetical protein H4582DRAFT_2056939 [Lactarius indigo]
MYPVIKYIALVSLGLLSQLGCTSLRQSGFMIPSKPYDMNDRPNWVIRYLSPIPMNIEGRKHYQLSDADAEWAALVPNNATLYLGPQIRLPKISMFHQLHCLDVFRREIMEAAPQDLTRRRHCLTILLNIELCPMDLAVLGQESEAEVQPRAQAYQCVGWRRVYRELSEIHYSPQASG